MPAAETLVILATYNEIENLPPLVDAIKTALPAADILVIDDNSPDGTGRWCDEVAAREPRLACIHRPGKLGLGSATLAGLRHGLADGYRFLITMDADFSHPPRVLSDLVAEMDRADVAIGSRYCPGGAIEGWPLRRRTASRALNAAARILLGLPTRDSSGAYRCYRAETLAKLDLDSIRSTGYAYLEEILWHLKRAGARFAETPITFVDRTRGHSKINAREAIAALGTLVRLGVRNWLGRKDRDFRREEPRRGGG